MSDLHWRRKLLYLKKESTYGTDPTHADTDAMLTRGLTINPYAGQTVDRANDKIYFGNDDQLNVNPYAEVTFGIELAGSGSAVDTPPAFSEALEACGLVETINASTSVAYAPDVGDLANEFESAGLEFYLDGQMQAVLGARGNVEFVVSPGSYPQMNFTFQGKYAAPTAVALPAGYDTSDFAAALPVTDVNTPTVTLDGENVVLHALNLNLGNVLAVRDLPNISDNVIIADRRPSGSITIEAPDLGTKDWYAEIRSDNGADNVALNVVHGTSATNICTLNCPVVQLTNMRPGEADGITTYTFDLIIKPSSGNDDLTVTFT